ncbi:hypothetical protein [Dyella sp. OK004]|uniref:hypothetical protein n=1 Tax=Dyella sp. OK004 TaxID=1855292 RepID=UPI001160B607|nr:hypothetical protein [Dyella sp. OK004]
MLKVAPLACALMVHPGLHAQTYFGNRIEGTLCQAGETVMFSCNSAQKKIAVCARANSDSPFGELRYRFGSDDRIELEFPKHPAPLASYASGNRLGDGFRGMLSYLHLRNGDTTYSVYFEAVAPTYSGEDAHETSGVIVESKGKIVARRICDRSGRTHSGMLDDPKFLGVALPPDTQGLSGFPNYHP